MSITDETSFAVSKFVKHQWAGLVGWWLSGEEVFGAEASIGLKVGSWQGLPL